MLLPTADSAWGAGWQLLPSLACTLCYVMNTDTLLKALGSLYFLWDKDTNTWSKYHVTEDDSSKFQKQPFIPRKVGSWENPESPSDKKNPSSPVTYFLKIMFCECVMWTFFNTNKSFPPNVTCSDMPCIWSCKYFSLGFFSLIIHWSWTGSALILKTGNTNLSHWNISGL